MSSGHDLHWLLENLAASTVAFLKLLGYTDETHYICPFPLCVTRLRAILTEKRTAGTCEVSIYDVDGAVAVPAAITFDADHPQFIDIEVDPTLATRFALGERLLVSCDTDAAWLPVTADLIVIPTLSRPYGP